MRILLLLTLGFPVLAAQLAAQVGLRAEPVICTSAPRAGEPSTDAAPRAFTALRLQVALPAPALPSAEPAQVVPFEAPEGSSARALTFVRHQRRQAT